MKKTRENISYMLSSLRQDDSNFNIKKIRKFFGSLDYRDDSNQTILHILVDNKYDEEKCYLAIKTLFQHGFNPNFTDYFNYNFIQTALYSGYSEKFIIKIIKEALEYGLNINHIDSDRDTIMHTAIYSDDYVEDIMDIYKLLCSNGYDSAKVDKDGRNILDAIIYQEEYSESQIKEFKLLFDNELCKNEKTNKNEDNISREIKEKNSFTISLTDKEIKELEKYGKILNKKQFLISPTIGREKELKNLMITLAQDKKNPLIVGESGVGKTVIVEELAFRINSGNVPNFLQGKIIFEVNPSDVVDGCQYVGQFENNINKMLKLCEKYELIIFIDEIHTIYGIGATQEKNSDMASILKHSIDRTNLKVIGTTTQDEYNAFFSRDALKRRFEKITIKEPDEKLLFDILNKTLEDYVFKTGILFESEEFKKRIIKLLILLTEKSHRIFDDNVNNPDLSISIIDKAFAIAKVNDSEYITSEIFKESITYCDRIYDSIKQQVISKISTENKIDKRDKILKIDFINKKY